MNLIDLNSRRAETDNAFVDPATSLRETADDIEAGRLPVTSVVTLVFHQDGSAFSLLRRVAKSDGLQTLALLEFAKAQIIAEMTE